MTPPLALAPASGAKASNLAFALGCLPRDRREDALVFYAFCREIDDIADEPIRTAEEKQALLDRWRAAVEGRESLPSTFESLIHRRDLDRGLLREIIEGVASDIEPRRFSTYADLQTYCWRVASAVGLVSIRIFGTRQPSSQTYAEQLGYALQITNILRDVGEDARLGRIYLPLEDCERFGVSEPGLLAGTPDGDFGGLMKFEAGRAREHFAAARSAFHPQDAAALAPAEMMRRMYEMILDRMEQDSFRVFSRRYRLTKLEKLGLLAGAWFRSCGRQAAAAE